MPVRTQIQIARKLKVNIISQNSPNSHLFSGQTNQIMQPLHCKKNDQSRVPPVPCHVMGEALLRSHVQAQFNHRVYQIQVQIHRHCSPKLRVFELFGCP